MENTARVSEPQKRISFFSNNLNHFFPNEKFTLGMGRQGQNGMSRSSQEISADQNVS